MSNHNLPVDLLLNVLGRLPVKSLLRFKCISKSWSALIDSQEFIKIHLNFSLMDRKAHKILLEGGCSVKELFSGDCDSPDNFIDTVEKLYHPYSRENVTLIASCNGLLCMKYPKSGVVLCNPWTKKHHKLPYKPIEIELPGGRVWQYSSYGFGYDDSNDDYKVVKLVGLQAKVSWSFRNEIQVYSLKSNSWRRIDDFPYPIESTTNCRSNGAFVNSSLHWMWRFNDLGYDFKPSDYSILAIDLRTEERRIIPVPDFSGHMQNIMVLNDCLCVVSFQNFYNMNVWMMKDYGVVDSWTKTIFNHPNYIRSSPILVPYPEGEKRIIFYNRRELIWYDIEKKAYEKINNILRVSKFIANIGCSVVSLVPPHAGRSRGTKRRKPSCRNTNVALRRSMRLMKKEKDGGSNCFPHSCR